MIFIDEEKRSELPDSEFGIESKRKFPLNTAEHVRSAIKLFGHAEEVDKKHLAKRIMSKAKEYNIEVPETTQVYKYYKESCIDESNTNNYKKIYDITMKMFKDSGRLPNSTEAQIKQFITNGKTDEFGGALCIAGLGTGYEGTCSKINKEIKPLGGKIHPDNYGTAMLSIKEDAVLTNEDNDDLDLPSTVIDTSKSIIEILDSVSPKNIYITSDWHIFKNHYTKEKNHVNTSEIISWCKENIKDDNVFLYLGDMSYRWINDKDKEEVKKIFKSLPGIKILVIGNHDEFSDGGDYEDYGFKYAVKDIYYKNIIFSHRPIDMSDKPGMLNIHGHKHHKDTEYHSMNGDANVNVYPSFHNNKPITLDRAINHKDWYMRNNKRSDWNGMSEASVENQIRIQEASNMINDIINKPKEMQEWAMNACNPIIGIQKPYVLKAIDNTGDCINSKLYALSPDIISDKYLVVDENSKLAIVDKSYFDNYYVEVYEYTGNRLNIGKIKEMYDSGNIVSPNYIYETLSGKHLLTQDQIDFDDQFKKVDLSDTITKMESYRATMQSNFDKINGAFFYIPAIDIQHECTINYKNALDVMADVNGYYLRNRFTHERTESFSNVDQLTEAMIKSISIN